MTTNTNPIAITGASAALVIGSSPDLALPLESESSIRAYPDGTTEPIDLRRLIEHATANPGAAIALAAGAGLLLGIVVKKMLPARRR